MRWREGCGELRKWGRGMAKLDRCYVILTDWVVVKVMQRMSRNMSSLRALILMNCMPRRYMFPDGVVLPCTWTSGIVLPCT